MPTFTEKSAVEDFIVELLEGRGWKVVLAESLERERLEEPLLVSELARAVKRLNVGVTEGDVQRVLLELRHQGTDVEGCRKALGFLKWGVPVKLEKSREVRFLKLLDFERPERNEFVVSRQVTHEGGRGRIRPDILLYVNGIPLVCIECKHPADPAVSWWDAYKQVIRDYQQKVPELFKYVQFGIAAENEARYFPTAPWRKRAKPCQWKEEGRDPLEGVLEMLGRGTLLDLVRNFVFVREERGEAKKIIARYMQHRAANRIVERVVRTLQGKGKERSGLVWHWQGSGKTLTMIFAAHKLFREPLLERPTIFVILDRTELEVQMAQEFAALDLGGIPIETISSIKELKETLAHDGRRGKRGIFVTLIHKFNPRELQQLGEELKREGESIVQRRNIVSLIDEGHRSQYGVLAAQMRDLLQGGFFFAFTGTPVAKKGRDTYRQFSPPGEGYLDKYFFTESIADGFTVKILHQLRLENAENIHLKREELEAFLAQEREEIPEHLREVVDAKVRRRLNTINAYMKNPKRLEMIAQDIADHFRKEVDGKFKAMVVAVDREACVFYKHLLDKLLPPEYSEVVITFSRKDKKVIREYEEDLRRKHRGKEIKDIQKDVIEKFKTEEQPPKILIVTDMLLTGFDAPILQTMYLDKPLKEHRLIQAIARTNRPLKGRKEAGLILDYVGILKNLKKAFEVYSEGDVAGLTVDVEKEAERFKKLVDGLIGLFEGADISSDRRKDLLEAVELLGRDERKAKAFRRGYREARTVFELLGPEPIKVAYRERYKWLTQMYFVYTRKIKREDPEETDAFARRYFAKTIQHVYRALDVGKIEKEFPILHLDQDYIKKLEEQEPDKGKRLADMLFSLSRFVLTDKERRVVYETIADKVERIVKTWREKTADLDKIYGEAWQLIKEVNALEQRKQQLGLSTMEHGMLAVLETEFEGDAEHMVRGLSRDVKKHIFPGWSIQKSALKDVGLVVRRFVRKQRLPKERREWLYDKLFSIIRAMG